jgi:hypothetical protein
MIAIVVWRLYWATPLNNKEGAEMSLISASTKKVSPNYLGFWVYFKAQFETFQITTFSPSTLNTKESPFLIAIHVWTDVIGFRSTINHFIDSVM